MKKTQFIIVAFFILVAFVALQIGGCGSYSTKASQAADLTSGVEQTADPTSELVARALSIVPAPKYLSYSLDLDEEDAEIIKKELLRERMHLLIGVEQVDIAISTADLEGVKYLKVEAFGLTRYALYGEGGPSLVRGPWEFILAEIMVTHALARYESFITSRYLTVDENSVVEHHIIYGGYITTPKF